VEFQISAKKELAKLDRTIQTRIINFLRARIATNDNPRRLGKALKGDKGELWRYRIGDYRAICRIEDTRLVVLVLEVGHRRQIYR
jgi:mRNA interferase RelE/StbE